MNPDCLDPNGPPAALEVDDDAVKPAVNKALYPLCPAEMTLREFEELTCKVTEMVMEVRRRFL